MTEEEEQQVRIAAASFVLVIPLVLFLAIFGGALEPSWAPVFRAADAVVQWARNSARFGIVLPASAVCILIAARVVRVRARPVPLARGTGTIAPTGPSQADYLGRAPFVAHMTSLMMNMGFSGGIVIGLPSPWGTGKSTVVGLLEKELGGKTPRPRFVRFHPWWFVEDPELERRFILELASQSGSSLGRWIARVSPSVASLADLADSAQLPLVSSGLKMLGDSFLKRGESEHAYRRLHDRLARSRRRLIVLVEDLDRLSPRAVARMLGTIRAVGDLPNTTVLMPYDHEAVVRSLEKEFGIDDGNDYLERMLDVVVPLPDLEPDALSDWLTAELEALVRGVPDSLWDAQGWSGTLRPAIDGLLHTPREVQRLVNNFAATYPPLAKEVNASDFMGVQAIAVFAPSVYFRMQALQNLLTHNLGIQGVLIDNASRKKSVEDLLKRAPESIRPQIGTILRHLFPYADELLGGIHGTTDLMQARAQRRVASPAYVALYFTRTLPLWVTPREELARLATGTADEIIEHLRTLPRSNLTALLRDINALAARGLAVDGGAWTSALLAIGDDLDERVRWDVTAESPLFIAQELASRLVRLDGGIDEKLRVLLDGAGGLLLVVSAAADLQRDGLLSPEAKAKIAARLRADAQNGKLTKTPVLSYIVNQWRNYDSSEKIAEAIEMAVASDEAFLAFVTNSVWLESLPGSWAVPISVLEEIGINVGAWRRRAATFTDRPGLDPLTRTGLEALAADNGHASIDPARTDAIRGLYSASWQKGG